MVAEPTPARCPFCSEGLPLVVKCKSCGALLDGLAGHALDHARAMLIFSAELRVKNFNFFVVLMVALVAAYSRVQRPWLLVLIATACGIISILFFLLDVRTCELIQDARGDLLRLEPSFGITMHNIDAWKDPERGYPTAARRRMITHTVLYRAIFGIAYVLSLAGIVGALWGGTS